MKFDYRRLKAERVAKGFTVEHVANKLGISKGYYSKKENEKSPIDVEEFAMILTILGLQISDIHIFFTQDVAITETIEIN